jgi:uncharacterized membrane protein
MRSPLFLLLAAGLLIACAETTPPLGPDREADQAKGPSSSNITIVDLGFTNALDINEQGRIVGWRQTSTGARAVMWTPSGFRGTSGTTTDLLDGGESYGWGINDAGEIAGGSGDASALHAFIWNGSHHALGEPEGAVGSFAEDVGEGSAGTRYTIGRIDFASRSRAAIWQVTGADLDGLTPLLLPGLSDHNVDQAIGTNGNGTIVGSATGAESNWLPARWTLSESGWDVVQLPLLPGATYGQAFDVNVDRVAVGFNGQTNSTSCSRGTVWAGDTPPTALPDLAGRTCSIAWAVNDAGQIAGQARDSRGRNQPVLWTWKPGGGYSVLALGLLKGTFSGEGRGLNEPLPDGSGALVLEVVGAIGNRAALWKVKLP